MQRTKNWGQDGGKLGQSRHQVGKSPTVYLEKRGGKVHIPCLDTERVGGPGSPAEWHGLIPEARDRSDRMSLRVLGDWDHMVGLVPTFSSHQNTIFPLSVQISPHTSSDIPLSKEEKIRKGVPLLNTDGNVLKGSGAHFIYLNVY